MILCQKYLWKHQCSCLPGSGQMPSAAEVPGSSQAGAKVLRKCPGTLRAALQHFLILGERWGQAF